MAKFIELHDTSERRILINSDWIMEILDGGENGAYITFGCVDGSSSNGKLSLNGTSIHIKESYATVKSMLCIDY